MARGARIDVDVAFDITNDRYSAICIIRSHISEVITVGAFLRMKVCSSGMDEPMSIHLGSNWILNTMYAI